MKHDVDEKHKEHLKTHVDRVLELGDRFTNEFQKNILVRHGKDILKKIKRENEKKIH